MTSSGTRLIAGMLPVVLVLAGCASSEGGAGVQRQSRAVVRETTEQDQEAIDAYNQHMLETGQGPVSNPAAGGPANAAPAQPAP